MMKIIRLRDIKPSLRMEQVMVRVPAEIREKIRHVARSQGVTESDICRSALYQFLSGFVTDSNITIPTA